MKVTMLVCCHKEDIMATAEPYMPLQVGKDISKIDLNIQGDNTGDNISCKNQSYCGLTGMYWAWKTTSDRYYNNAKGDQLRLFVVHELLLCPCE